MSYMKSREDVKKILVLGAKNLTVYQKSVTERKILAEAHDPLDGLTKMPKEMTIIGRIQFLAQNEKSRNGRFKVIANELKKIWENLNFPFI